MLVYYYIFTLMYYRTKEFSVREGRRKYEQYHHFNERKGITFFKVFHQQKYNVVDFNLIEELDWRRLTHEDLQQMDERSFWQQNKSIYALRNDFTDQLFRYYSNYPTHLKKVAYAGILSEITEL